MEITCPNCQYSRNVPDDKVPAGSVNATCPQCGTKFRFRAPGVSPEAPADTPPEVPSDTPLQAPSEAPRDEAAPAPPEPPAQEPPRPVRNVGTLSEDVEDDSEAAPRPDPRDAAGPEPEGDIWQRLDAMGGERPDGEPGPGMEFAPDGAPVVEVPFERLDQYGFFGGLYQTCKRSITAPRLFFGTMPVDRGYGRPVLYFLLLNVLTTMLQLALVMALYGVQLPPGAELPPEAADLAPGAVLTAMYLFVLLIWPLLMPIVLFTVSAVMHLLLTPLNAVSGGFQGTVRVMAYASFPVLFLLIPYAGFYIATSWYMVLATYGLRAVHRTSLAKAGVSMVVLAVLCIALLVVLAQAMLAAGVPGAGM